MGDPESLVDRQGRIVHRLQDLANGREGERTDLDQRPDQAQSTYMLTVVLGLVRRGRPARRQEILAEVVLDRRDRHAGPFTELRDLHASPSGVDNLSG